MRRRIHLLVFLLMAWAALFLAGCGADIEQSVTFYRDEAWEADIKVGLPGEMLALAGSPAEIEQQIEQTVAEWEALGTEVSWNSSREDTTLIYTFHVKGEGLATLSEVVFDNNAQFAVEELDGERQIHFSQFVTGNILEANSNTLTLIGGNIVSSNGRQLDNGAVQWVNPSGRIEAVLTEKSRFGLATLLIPVALLAATGGGWFFYRQRRQRVAFCARCGTQLGPGAKFCPSCGSPH